MSKENKTTKLISFILIISILLPNVLLSRPKQAEAQGVLVDDIVVRIKTALTAALEKLNLASTLTNTATTLKDWAQTVLEQILKMIAKRLLAEMTQSTINWINSGFHGAPLFLENPDSFFKDIAKNEVRNLVDMIGYDTFHFPFGRETALGVIDSYKSQLYENSQYTLSKVINDPDLLVRYRNDFNYGGWNGFLINTKYPQNNYLGFQMIVQENLASRLEGVFQAPAEKVRDALQQGMGFLSPQTCPDNPKYNNGINEFVRPKFKGPTMDPGESNDDFMNRYNKAAEEWEKENYCPRLVNTTPGSVAANQVFSALETPFLQTALDGAIGNSLAAIFDALLGKFLEVGLNSLSDAFSGGGEGGRGSDNWSYDDPLGDPVTLDDYPSDAPATLNIPTNVSIRVGQTTSAPISGGSGDYNIKTAPDSGIATAKIDSSGSSRTKLSLTGVAPGTTEVTIEDSSDSEITASIRIEVNAIGALAIIPTNCTSTIDVDNACISTSVSNIFSARIDGGTGPYNISAYPNQNIAIATFASNSLVISGVNEGETFVIIKDSLGEEKRVDIRITSQEELNIQQDISVAVGEEKTVIIDGGTRPYSIENVSGVGATVKISETDSSQLIITGVTSNEQMGVIIKDSSTPEKQASATITVTDAPTTLVVSPSSYISIHENQTASVTISGGTEPYTLGLRAGDFHKLKSSKLTGNTFTITAANENRNTWVEINDSATPSATVTINIIVRD